MNGSTVRRSVSIACIALTTIAASPIFATGSNEPFLIKGVANGPASFTTSGTSNTTAYNRVDIRYSTASNCSSAFNVEKTGVTSGFALQSGQTYTINGAALYDLCADDGGGGGCNANIIGQSTVYFLLRLDTNGSSPQFAASTFTSCIGPIDLSSSPASGSASGVGALAGV